METIANQMSPMTSSVPIAIARTADSRNAASTNPPIARKRIGTATSHETTLIVKLPINPSPQLCLSRVTERRTAVSGPTPSAANTGTTKYVAMAQVSPMKRITI